MNIIDLTVTLTSGLHHGAGTAGNTSLLRTHEIVTPDGAHRRVPFLSANSVRHGLRDALAWHLVEHAGVEPGSLSKAAVDLLWSGGAVTSTGSQVDLDLARRVDDLFPALGLLGYAARSDIVAGTLRVSDLELVCQENAWRLPVALADTPRAEKGAAAYRGEEFGTRHDVADSPVTRFIQATDEVVDSVQMIYDVQTLKAGSMLHGDLMLLPSASDGHRLALSAALALWAPGGVVHLGAKTAVGYGAGRVNFSPAPIAGDLQEWTDHVRGHAAQILGLVGDVTG